MLFNFSLAFSLELHLRPLEFPVISLFFHSLNWIGC